MNLNWALTTPSKKLVFTDSDYHKLKLIQMMVAKSFMLDIVVWQDKDIIQEPELDQHNKVKFIKYVLDAEDAGFNSLVATRNNDGLKATLLAIKDFNSMVYADDPELTRFVELELAELDNWKTAPQMHRSFIFRTLYNLDFSQNLDELKSLFREDIKRPPHDDYYVYEELNRNLVTFLDAQQ